MNNTLNLRTNFLKYTSLNILGMVGFSFYILVDTFFIALALGTNGLAGLSFALPVFSIFQGIGLMIAIGSATLFSVNKASDLKATTDTSFTHAILLAIFFGLLFILAGLLFSREIGSLLGASGEVLDLTDIYLNILLMFVPFFMINHVFMAFIRNDLNPKLPMIAMITSSIFNVILDYILMFPFGLGMAGASLATAISPLVSILILSRHLYKKQNTFHLAKCKIQFSKFIETFKLGLSSLISEVATGISSTTFNLLIFSVAGNTGVAAYSVIINIALVVICMLNGLAQGAQPLSSVAFGTKNISSLNKLLKYSISFSLFISLLVYIVLLFFVDGIVSIFNTENNIELAEIARDGTFIYFIGYFFAGLNIVGAAYLSSILKPKRAMAISALRGIFVFVPVAILFCELLGLVGIWISFGASEFIVLLITLFFLKQAAKENLKI